MDFTPYELRHLAAHLVAAERYFDLHRLLTWQTGEPGKNTWYEACAEAGEIAGYLGDVRRGWDAAAARLGADPVECLALQARYALMTATLRSLASAVPPSLMAELVRTGVWTVEQAVEAARRVPDSEQQVEALMGVSTVPVCRSRRSTGSGRSPSQQRRRSRTTTSARVCWRGCRSRSR